MDKDFYGYVRPSSPNSQWRLEKIPLGENIITKEVMELKPGKFMSFDRKEYDGIGVSINDKGMIKLPSGKYLIQFTATAEAPVASQIVISINNYPIYNYLSASTPVTLSGSTVIVSNGNNEFGIKNEGSDLVKLTNTILTITRLN